MKGVGYAGGWRCERECGRQTGLACGCVEVTVSSD